jgi:hypothetical protein
MAKRLVVLTIGEATRIANALFAVADDLESEVEIRFKGTLNYPSRRRRYESDMEVVLEARGAAALLMQKLGSKLGN